MVASLRVQLPLYERVSFALKWKYLTQREQKSLEKSSWLVECFLESHVEVIIQFLVLGDIVAYFIEDVNVNKSSASEADSRI
jgi:hypothetical protein